MVLVKLSVVKSQGTVCAIIALTTRMSLQRRKFVVPSSKPQNKSHNVQNLDCWNEKISVTQTLIGIIWGNVFFQFILNFTIPGRFYKIFQVQYIYSHWMRNWSHILFDKKQIIFLFEENIIFLLTSSFY